MTYEQYVLVGSTVRSYLSWLKDTGRVEGLIEDNKYIARPGGLFARVRLCAMHSSSPVSATGTERRKSRILKSIPRPEGSRECSGV